MDKRFFSSHAFKTAAFKTLVYGSAIFLLIILQCTVFARMSLFGAVPDLALCAVIVISMKEGERVGAPFAIASGFLSCALGGSDTYLYILFSFAVCYAVVAVSSRLFSNNLPSFAAYTAFSMSAKGMFDLITGALRAENFYFWNVLWNGVIPEFFCTMLFCIPVYFAFKALTSVFHKKHLHKGDFI